jgi:hypothetical protein
MANTFPFKDADALVEPMTCRAYKNRISKERRCWRKSRGCKRKI